MDFKAFLFDVRKDMGVALFIAQLVWRAALFCTYPSTCAVVTCMAE